jgi:hypothetical protein
MASMAMLNNQRVYIKTYQDPLLAQDATEAMPFSCCWGQDAWQPAAPADHAVKIWCDLILGIIYFSIQI